MMLWPAPVKVKMKFHELRHSTNTLLAALGVPENVRADILGHRTRAMTRRYTHLSVQQMREGFRKLDAKTPIRVAPGVPASLAAYLKGRVAPPREEPANVVPLAEARHQKRVSMQQDATRGTPATDAGLTPRSATNQKPWTQAKKSLNPGLIGAEHRVRTGDLRLGKAPMRMCTAMQRESTLRNLSRQPALQGSRLCQQMQRNAARLLTQD
jgi:hypothetical protein